jgi:hypothetical protein
VLICRWSIFPLGIHDHPFALSWLTRCRSERKPVKGLGIAFGTITRLKIGYMAWKKRIGQTLESCLSAGGNENRDAGVADKHYFSVCCHLLCGRGNDREAPHSRDRHIRPVPKVQETRSAGTGRYPKIGPWRSADRCPASRRHMSCYRQPQHRGFVREQDGDARSVGI